MSSYKDLQNAGGAVSGQGSSGAASGTSGEGGGRVSESWPAESSSVVSRPRPPKLYRIGEVVDYSGMSRQTIHNYTTMGLIHESRWTQGGHRLYDESVFERLDKIAQMKASNRPLQEIRDYFAGVDMSGGAKSA